MVRREGSGDSAIPAIEKPNLKGIWPALLLALIISIYSVIDGAAVKLTDPLPYAALDLLRLGALHDALHLPAARLARAEARLTSYPWRLLATGALIVASYMLALWAYRLSSVSYVGAIREVNVVIGALAGWQFLGEKFGPAQLAGSIVIFAGIVVIAVFG